MSQMGEDAKCLSNKSKAVLKCDSLRYKIVQPSLVELEFPCVCNGPEFEAAFSELTWRLQTFPAKRFIILHDLRRADLRSFHLSKVLEMACTIADTGMICGVAFVLECPEPRFTTLSYALTHVSPVQPSRVFGTLSDARSWCHFSIADSANSGRGCSGDLLEQKQPSTRKHVSALVRRRVRALLHRPSKDSNENATTQFIDDYVGKLKRSKKIVLAPLRRVRDGGTMISASKSTHPHRNMHVR